MFAAALAGALDGALLEAGAGRARRARPTAEIVQRLSGLPADRILPEAYRLTTPASPHRAAELDGVEIDVARLAAARRSHGPLVIEGAGGLLVPLDARALCRSICSRAGGCRSCSSRRTALGTINHSLLSIEALRGAQRPAARHRLRRRRERRQRAHHRARSGGVRRLGRLPSLDPLDAAIARAHAFAANFRAEDFLAGPGMSGA